MRKRIAALFLGLMLCISMNAQGGEVGVFLGSEALGQTLIPLWTPSAVPSDYVSPTPGPTDIPIELHLFADIPFGLDADELVKVAKEKARLDLEQTSSGDFALSNQKAKVNGYDADIKFGMNREGLASVTVRYDPFESDNVDKGYEEAIGQYKEIWRTLTQKYGEVQRGKLFVNEPFKYPLLPGTREPDYELIYKAVINSSGIWLRCEWRNIRLEMWTFNSEKGIRMFNEVTYSRHGSDRVDFGDLLSYPDYNEYLSTREIEVSL